MNGDAAPEPNPAANVGAADHERVRFLRLLHEEVERLRALGADVRNELVGGVRSRAAAGEPIASPVPRLPESAPSIESKREYHVSEFLIFHDEDFVRNAYRGILGRAPDVQGFSDFLAALRQGRRSKIEILGRLRFSREGRTVAVTVRGLIVPFAVRTARRIPVLGRLLGITQYVVRLPDVVRNHERLEAAVFEQELDTRRRINIALTSIERALAQLADSVGQNARAAETQRKQLAEQAAGQARSFDSLKQAVLADISSVRHAIEMKADVATTNSLAEALARKVDHAELDAVRVRADELNADVAQLASTKADRGELDELNTRFLEAAAELGARVGELARIKSDRAAIDPALSNVEQLAREALKRISRLGERSSELEQRVREQQQALIYVDHRIEHLSSETATKPVAQEVAMANEPDEVAAETDAFLATFYVAFEDRFRGTRDEIKHRMEVYLPIVAEANAGTEERPVLDIGCGRGEWLELLGDNGLLARGVDINDAMVAYCRALKLDVHKRDAIGYLRTLNADSVGIITGMHVIEHMPFAQMIMLFDEALRVLRPGGLVVFETPNPENLIVGACAFYSDPTHRRPLPPETARFVAQERGFTEVRLLRLHPYPEPALISGTPSELQERMNALLYGPQDYAVIGRKA